MGSKLPEEDFDAYAFVQEQRAGRKIKRPKKILSHTDDQGLITIFNETERPCIDDEVATRVVLVADLRASHPQLKPGLLGRTVPRTSDYYRYVVVEFDNGVVEVVGLSAVQPVVEDAAEAFSNTVRASVIGTSHDWDDDIALRHAREWETSQYRGSLDTSTTIRDGIGPHQLYAYTFPSLIALAESRKQEIFPVKVGYTGVATELAPALSRIHDQLGESAGRFEAATVLGIWNTRDGRALETQVHKYLRASGRKVESSVGREWYLTNAQELHEVVQSTKPSIKPSGVPINGPTPELRQAATPPCVVWSQTIQVVCCGISRSGGAYITPMEFDDLLEEAATPEVKEQRSYLSQQS
jgi:hypothetical protein